MRVRAASESGSGGGSRGGSGGGSGGGAAHGASGDAAPVCFETAEAYQEWLRPLLLLELREEVCKALEEGRAAIPASPLAGSSPRRLHDLGGASCWEATVKLSGGAPQSLQELDVLSLSVTRATEASWAHALFTAQLTAPPATTKGRSSPTAPSAAPLPLSGGGCLAVVWRRPRDAPEVTLRLAVPRGIDLRGAATGARAGGDGGDGGGRCSGGGGGERAALCLHRAGSCSSALREWSALGKLGQMPGPLLGMLLDPRTEAAARAKAAEESVRLKPEGDKAWEKRLRHIERLSREARLDEHQLGALRHTAELVHQSRHGFALVQGPPGTGKSTTLLTTLNVLHNAATQNHYDDVLSAATLAVPAPAPAPDPARQTSSTAGGAGGADLLSRISQSVLTTSQQTAQSLPHFGAAARRGRILVCAHSNAAVDELLVRLLHRRPGFIDEYGGVYVPNMVRVGSHAAEAVRPCSLDARVNELAERVARDEGGGLRDAMQQETRRKLLQKSTARARAETVAWMRERHEWIPRWKRAQSALVQWDEAATVSSGGRGDGAGGGGGGGGAEDEVWRKGRRELEQECLKAQGRVEESARHIMRLHDEAIAYQTELSALHCLQPRRGTTPTPTGGSAGSGPSPGSGAALSLSREERSHLEAVVLSDAQIVFCTLSAAGDRRLASVPGGFETAVVDEAAQAGEASTLVAMQYGVRLVALVGDPQQLPATVISLRAKRLGYGRSLFERLQQGGHSYRMLTVQYRMHPAIRTFPSVHFYRGLLRDGANVARAARLPPGSVGGAPSFLAAPASRIDAGSADGVAAPSMGPPELRRCPYAFFNVVDSRQGRGVESSHSLRNEAEAEMCAQLLLALLLAQERTRAVATVARDARGEAHPSAAAGRNGHGCPWGELYGRVAVLTPYNEQVRTLRDAFARHFGPSAHNAIVCSNVDSFQGKEADTVLYSSVRSGSGGLGFVNDLRRLNVALTRARHALFVVGSAHTLSSSDVWRALLDDAKDRRCYCEVSASKWAQAGAAELSSSLIPITLLDGHPWPWSGGPGRLPTEITSRDSAGVPVVDVE